MLSDATRSRFPQSHWILLDRLEHDLLVLRDAEDAQISFIETSDPLLHFNSFIDFAIAVYASKLRQLYEALAYGLETERYLVYAQSGRAILENVATIRYYSRHVDLLAAHQAWRNSTLSDPILRQANLTLDKFLRGTRFSWDAFLEARAEDITTQPDQPHLAQIHSGTCLCKWFKERPQLESLYTLLCDLVHPNQGSNLLVMRSSQQRLVAKEGVGVSAAMFIVAPSLAGILSAFKDFSDAISALAALQLQHPNAH